MIPAGLRAALGDEPGGVFYLHGTDESSKDAAARSLAEAHLDSGTADFNHDVLRGSEVTVDSLATTLATLPMMAPWRVVVLKETHKLATSPRLRALVLEAAAAPPPGLALILVASVPEGSKARFYPELARRCRSVHFRVPTGRALHHWLIERCRVDFGCGLSEGAARALEKALAGSVPALVQELEKLSALVGEGSEITTDDVRRAGTEIPEQDRWKWFDMVGERRYLEALRGLEILIRHGEHEVGLVIGLTTHLLRLGVVAAGGPKALEAALPDEQKWIARKYARNYALQARRWTPAEIERALAGLLQVDRLRKAAGTPHGEILERWLLEAASEAAA